MVHRHLLLPPSSFAFSHLLLSPSLILLQKKKIVSIDGYEDVPHSEKSLQKAVAYQPVSVAIEDMPRFPVLPFDSIHNFINLLKPEDGLKHVQKILFVLGLVFLFIVWIVRCRDLCKEVIAIVHFLAQ
ncbi:unnamed protein product [Rhodiola kirilowii]